MAVLVMRTLAAMALEDIEAGRKIISKATHYRIDTILAGCILSLMAYHDSTRPLLKRIVAFHRFSSGSLSSPPVIS